MEKITFENSPSTKTPISADNLNLLQENVEKEFVKTNKNIYEDLISATKTTNSSDYGTTTSSFLPFISSGTYSIDIQIGTNLQWVSKNVEFEDVSGTTYGIEIPAGIKTIKLETNVRYQHTGSSSMNINTTIYRVRNGAAEAMRGVAQSVPASSRYTANFSTYIPVQEGDFIFVGSWRSNKATAVTVSSVDNATSLMVEILQYD